MPSPPQSKSPDAEQHVDLRRSYTMPSRSSPDSITDHSVVLRQSKSDVTPVAVQHRLDQFGFILNMDSHGNMLEHDPEHDDEEAPKLPVEKVPTIAEAMVTERREKKWNTMMGTWPFFEQHKKRLVLKRLRKGVPHSQRGTVWKLIGGVPEKIDANKGHYDRLVKEAYDGSTAKKFKTVQETIERDLHRTYPRHCMFFDAVNPDDEVEPEDDEEVAGLCGSEELSNMIRELEFQPPSEPSEPPEEGHPSQAMLNARLDATGGQASLRRVLKAYSLYDKDIGYCQGMNFIAGMFLTLMSEEEAFWLLVAVMYDEPCKMRGLFGEGMQEAHKVLYVAEKLIRQFLPRLAKHLDRENVHITMFATQWLLTQYTSSFPFDLVTRVWDCFLREGWKITYRVMLALLQNWQGTLLKMSFEEILGFFRDLPGQCDGTIVDMAVKIPLRWSHILRYEKEYEARDSR